MGYRYRKSIRLPLGLRLNASNRGVGVSAGAKGARWSLSPTGRRTQTLSIPGTGIAHMTSVSATSPGPVESTGGRSWVRRHKVLAGLGVLFGIGAIGSACDSGEPAKEPISVLSPSPTASPTPSPTPSPKPSPTTVKPSPKPVKKTTAPVKTDPDYGTCAAVRAAGKGPYYAGKDPEYSYYRDNDGDGVVCE